MVGWSSNEIGIAGSSSMLGCIETLLDDKWLIGVFHDGLIRFLYGPFEGKMNYVGVVHESTLQLRLVKLFHQQKNCICSGIKLSNSKAS